MFHGQLASNNRVSSSLVRTLQASALPLQRPGDCHQFGEII